MPQGSAERTHQSLDCDFTLLEFALRFAAKQFKFGISQLQELFRALPQDIRGQALKGVAEFHARLVEQLFLLFQIFTHLLRRGLRADAALLLQFQLFTQDVALRLVLERLPPQLGFHGLVPVGVRLQLADPPGKFVRPHTGPEPGHRGARQENQNGYANCGE